MATKQKSSKKPRTPKTSKKFHGGGGKVTLTPLQRVLIRGAHPRVFDLRDTRREPAVVTPATVFGDE